MRNLFAECSFLKIAGKAQNNPLNNTFQKTSLMYTTLELCSPSNYQLSTINCFTLPLPENAVK